MKIFLLILLVLSITLAQDTTTESEGQCAKNPILRKLKNYALQLKEDFDDNDKADLVLSKIQEIIESDGATLNLENPTTDFCSEFDGQNSCCTQEFVDNLPFLIKSFVRRRQREIRPKIKAFLKQLGKGIAKCGGMELLLEFLQGEAVQEAAEAIKECNQNQIKNSIKFLKKNTCAICIGADDLAEKFQDLEGESPKLKVTQESMDRYEEGAKRQFRCQRKVFNVIEQYVRDFMQNNLPDTRICKRLKRNVIEFLDGETIIPDIPSDCQNKAKSFEQGCLEENEATDTQDNLDLTTDNAQFRFLQESNDSDYVVVSDGSAYSIYDDDSDSQSGATQEDEIFEEVQDEDDTNDSDNGDGSQSGNNSEEDLASEFDISFEDIPEEGILSPGDDGYEEQNDDDDGEFSSILKVFVLSMITIAFIL